MGLAGQMCGSQVWVDIACVRGTIVMEGVRGLSGDGGGDVGLLAPMTPISLGYHVLLGLEENMIEVLSVNFISPVPFFLNGTPLSFKMISERLCRI